MKFLADRKGIYVLIVVLVLGGVTADKLYTEAASIDSTQIDLNCHPIDKFDERKVDEEFGFKSTKDLISETPYLLGEYFKLRLPGAVGGKEPITYRFINPLPDGLYIHVDTDNTILMYGYPKMHLPHYTLLAEDSLGNMDSLSFSISRSNGNVQTREIALSPNFYTIYEREDTELYFPIQRNYTQRLKISASLGNPILYHDERGIALKGTTFEIEGLEESGIDAQYNAYEESVVFTGRIDRASRFPLKLTITDIDGEKASLDMTLISFDPHSEDSSPQFASTLPEQNWELGEYVNIPIPEARGGNGKLTYELTVPANWPARARYSETDYGELFAELRGNLVGHVKSLAPPGVFKYTVTDQDGDTDTLEIRVSVEPSGLQFSSEVPDQDFIAREEGVYIELPTATGGDGNYHYSLSPSLPDGIEFVTDFTKSSYSTDNVPFSPDAIPPPTIYPFPTASNSQPYPKLLDVEDRNYILGSTHTAFTEQEYHYTVSDGAGATSTLSFRLTINEPEPSTSYSRGIVKSPSIPSQLLSYSDIPPNNTSGELAFPIEERNRRFWFARGTYVYQTLPAPTGAVGEITYQISQAIKGLHLQKQPKDYLSCSVFGIQDTNPASPTLALN